MRLPFVVMESHETGGRSRDRYRGPSGIRYRFVLGRCGNTFGSWFGSHRIAHGQSGAYRVTDGGDSGPRTLRDGLEVGAEVIVIGTSVSTM